MENGKDRSFEIRQYLKQAEKLYNLKWKDIFYSFKGINELYEKDYAASESFAPIILIDQNNIKRFFEIKLSELEDEILIDLCEKYKVKAINKEKDKPKNNELKDYSDAPNSIFKILDEYPPIYTFVFTILFNKIDPFVSPDKKGITDPKERTEELWRFTLEYVQGLHELAKNIVEHSSTKEGIITIRAYDTTEQDEEDGIKKVLETHLFDFGDEGIIQKLKDVTKKNKGLSFINKNDSEVLNDDLQILEGEFKLKDFIAPTPKTLLKQQLYRDLAHYGLMKFYRLIKNNEGNVESSTTSPDKSRDLYSNKDTYSKVLSMGTSYFFQLPFKHELFQSVATKEYKESQIASSPDTISGLSELLELKVVNNISEVGKKEGKRLLNLSNREITISDRADEGKFFNSFGTINEGSFDYLAIDMKDITLSSSSLLRIMAYLSSNYKQSIILYNLKNEVYEQMLRDNKTYNETMTKILKESIPIWYENKAILVFTKTEIKASDLNPCLPKNKANNNEKESVFNFYFADVLFGKNESEFKAANFTVSHTFPNAYAIKNEIEKDNEFEISNCLKPFFYNSSLMPFDVLLPNNENETLFQSNLKTVLNNRIPGLQNDCEQGKHNDPLINFALKDGYRIRNTHFKIGAKFHASDFYYAERLFNNSYYTARIAMLLALKIKNQIKEKSQAITLVGYETYSELLLSLIKKLLKNGGYNDINHCITIDVGGKPNYRPNNITPRGKIIIIVPISSTGSTIDKIIKNIKEKFGNDDDFSFFTVIKATDENFTKIIKQEDSLIKVSTEWQEPKKCKWCFTNSKSKPLFETDKSSLIPALIFNLPESKIIDKGSISLPFDKVNFGKSLIYMGPKRNNEFFLYSTDTNKFIDDNKINNWLQEVKKELQIGTTDKTIIIAPNHYSNSQFVNLVNDGLFNSSATIIYYQLDVDYLNNFKLLYKPYLDQKTAKIFFVDDALISGKTFFGIYDLFRYSTDYKVDIEGAIFLSNKSSADINKRVNRAAKKLYSFVNIYLPSPPKVFGKNPLEHEIKRYEELSRKSLHDVLRKHYQDRCEDLKGDEANNKKEENRDRHLKMFKATHKIYEYFKIDKNIKELTLDDLVESCGFKKGDAEDKIAILKVLSQYPFLLYKPIREKAFEWHKEWINLTIKDLQKNFKEPNESNPFNYSDFELLKFLIRRSIFLNNYIIVENDFLTLISLVFLRLFNDNNPVKRKAKEKIEMKPKPEELPFHEDNSEYELNDYETANLKDFHIFLLQQYVELFHKNGWCANKVVENIKNVEDNFKATQQGKQFLRMLKIEAAAVLNDFYRLLDENKGWKNLYKPEGNLSNTIERKNEKIKNFFKEEKGIKLLESNKFLLSDFVLELKEEGEDKNKNLKSQFINFLWLKQFFCTDHGSRAAKIKLKDKTEAIFDKLKCLFGNNDNDKKPGAFFVVNDGSGESHLVYDKDFSGLPFIGELDKEKHKLLFEFMEGENVEYSNNGGKKTIAEYERNETEKDKNRDGGKEEKKWKELYSLADNPPFKSFVSGSSWLLLIRISDSNCNTLGLIGFHGDLKFQEDLLAKQLLMLLRSDMAAFIERHHKTDEFSALREAEAIERFAYLAGHGRKMMQDLASYENSTFIKKVVSTMEKLQYLFATKLISPKGYTEGEKQKNDKDIFHNIFIAQKIDQGVLDTIYDIAKTIYKSKWVENEVDVDFKGIVINDEHEFSFQFNKEILLFICFELLINAKKNRFHFIGDGCEKCKSSKNTLEIKFNKKDESDGGQLVIEIAGTGPGVPVGVKNKINAGKSVKPDYEISGINLITKVIQLINGGNRIEINPENDPPKCFCGMCRNIVKVTLNPMKKNETEQENINN